MMKILITISWLLLIGCSTENTLVIKNVPKEINVSMQEVRDIFLKQNSNTHSGFVRDLIVTKSGDIITGSSDKTIRVWNVLTGKEKRKILGHIGLKNEGTINAIALSPNEKFLAVGGSLSTNQREAGVIRIYDYVSGKLLKKLKSHNNVVLDLNFSSDGKFLISGSADYTAKVWNMNSFNLHQTIKFHSSSIYGVGLIVKNNNYYGVTVSFTHIALHDLKTNTVVNYHTRFEYNMPFLAISDKHIAVIMGKHILKIYDYNLTTMNTVNVETALAGLAYSKNQKLLISGTYSSPFDVNVFDVTNNYRKKTSFAKHNNATIAVGFLSNEKAISIGGDNYTIYIWNKETGKIDDEITSLGDIPWKVGISNHGITWKTNKTMIKTFDLKKFQVRTYDNTIKGLFSVFGISKENRGYSLKDTFGGEYEHDKAKLVLFKDNSVLTTIIRDRTNGQTHECYGFYEDKIISGGMHGTLKIYNLKGQEIANLKGHTNTIVSLAVDGNRLISGGTDQTIRIWDLSKLEKEMKPQLSLFISKNNEWVTWTNEGYFNASKQGMEYIYFHLNQGINKEAIEVSMKNLYDHFYRPDLIKIKLAGDEENYQKVINANTYKTALQNPPPTVKIKTGNQKVNQDKIKVVYDIKDNNGGVGFIRIYQEGKLIQTIGEGKVNKQSANIDTVLEQNKLDKANQANQNKYLTSLIPKAVDNRLEISDTVANQKSSTTTKKAGAYEIEVDLISGKNEIAIEAFNKTNTVASFRESIVIEADIPKKEPKLYAIVVGVDEFESKPKKFNLNYAQNDAQSVKQEIENRIGKTFNETEVKYLIGKEVTKTNISNATKAIANKAKLEDTIIFYISTHGRVVKGDLYFLPHNNKYFKDYIDFQEIFKAIQSIKALNQIFIVDACESGKANDIVSAVYDSRASVLAKSAGVHMLLATTKGAYAFEPNPEAKGVKKVETFTQRVLKSMNNRASDTNGDGFVSIVELSKNLKANQESVEYQYPVIRNVGGDVRLVEVE